MSTAMCHITVRTCENLKSDDIHTCDNVSGGKKKCFLVRAINGKAILVVTLSVLFYIYVYKVSNCLLCCEMRSFHVDENSSFGF